MVQVLISFLSLTCVVACVVCVWGDKGDGYRLIIKWNVEFSGLKFLREQVSINILRVVSGPPITWISNWRNKISAGFK